jgi:hypothetical protein
LSNLFYAFDIYDVASIQSKPIRVHQKNRGIRLAFETKFIVRTTKTFKINNVLIQIQNQYCKIGKNLCREY